MNSKTKSCAGLLKHKVKQTKNYKKSKLKQVKCKYSITNLNKANLKTIKQFYLCTKKTQKALRTIWLEN